MVTIPPSTGNFSIPWAVDGTARIAEIPGLPIMPLYGDVATWGPFFSPVKAVNDVVAGLADFYLQGTVLEAMFVQLCPSCSPSMYRRWCHDRCIYLNVRIGGGFGKFEPSVASISFGSLALVESLGAVLPWQAQQCAEPVSARSYYVWNRTCGTTGLWPFCNGGQSDSGFLVGHQESPVPSSVSR
ncbi:hypothetical protein Tco_0640352 [Tanacetum coccineum]